MIVQRIAATPEQLPFDPGEVARHCRAEGSYFWAEIDSLGRAAAAEVERICNVALINQTIRVTLFGWRSPQLFPLPVTPALPSPAATMIVDGDAFEEFDLFDGERPYIRLRDDPTDRLRESTVVIEYTAGFGPHGDTIPPDLVHAIMDQTAVLFDARGPIEKNSVTVSPAVWRVAARYRRVAV